LQKLVYTAFTSTIMCIMKKVKKTQTRISFLRKLYTDDPYISNEKAWKLLQAEFPHTKAMLSSIQAWKTRLRKQGTDIPYQRIT